MKSRTWGYATLGIVCRDVEKLPPGLAKGKWTTRDNTKAATARRWQLSTEAEPFRAYVRMQLTAGLLASVAATSLNADWFSGLAMKPAS
jgi:hypothetical protein